MNARRSILLVALLTSATAIAADWLELPAVGSVEWPKGWKLLARGRDTTSRSDEDKLFWVVLGRKTNEFLSFSIRSNVTYRTETRFYADSAHEMFVEGWPWCVRTNALERTAWTLGTRVESVDVYEALRYAYVSERIGQENMLAQGFVLFGDTVVFVQHTSGRPETPELIENVARSVMHALAQTSGKTNLRLFKDEKER